MTHYEKLENMYLSAPCNKPYNPLIDISEGSAEVSIEMKPEFHHAAGAIHGSVYFKMLDDAAFFAANSLVKDVFVVTANFNIHMLKPVVRGKLISKGVVKTQAGSQIISEATLFDEDENIIATGNGSFIKSKVKLNKDIGYN